MNEAVPWSIKDVSFDAREAARAAAERAGVSVGDWLDSLISQHVPESRGSARAPSAPDAGLSDQLQRTAAMMAQPARQKVAYHRFAATGTDGPHPLAAGDAIDARAESSRPDDHLMRSTALQTMAERLARFEQQPWMAAVPFGGGAAPIAAADDSLRAEPVPSVARSSRLLPLRNAVAEIARRQAALDAEPGEPIGPAAPVELSTPAVSAAETGTPVEPLGVPVADRPVSPQVPAAETPPASLMQELGQAVSVLETRLAGERRRSGRGSRDKQRSRDPEGTRPSPAAAAAQVPDRAIEPAAPPPATLGQDDKAAFEALGRDLRRTVARIEGGESVPSADAAQPRDDDAVWSEIRALLDRFRPGSTLDALDERLRELSDRLDHRSEAPVPTGLIEGLARRVEDIHASLRSATPATDMRSLEALLAGVAKRVERVRETSSEVHNLEEMVRHLTAKIDANQSPIDARAVGALETQIARLGERLERSEASLSSLDAVERSLSELFTQIEQTRHAAIDAAETAARTAAKDTLRAAMQQSAIGQPQDGAVRVADKVGQELAEFRLQNGIHEQRTQASLAGLHDVMAKLLGHLEAVESGSPEMGRAPRPGPAAVDPVSPADAAEETSRFAEVRVDEPKTRPVQSDVDPIDSLIEPRSEPGRAKAPEIAFEPRTTRSEDAGRIEERSPTVESEGPASFIAAARRAAQASQASAAAGQASAERRKPSTGAPGSGFSAGRALAQARAYLAERRRPLLLSVAGLVLLVGALEVVRTGLVPAADEVVAAAPPTVAAGPAPEAAAGIPTAAEPKPAADSAAGRAEASTIGSPATSQTAGLSSAAPVAAAPAAAVAPEQKPTASADAGPTTAKPRAGNAAIEAPAPKPARSANPFLAGMTGGADGLPDGLKSRAEAGDAAAEYEVALRFAEGRTVARDLKAAATWLQKAAAQGLAPAQYRLGSVYEKGLGENRDPALALAYYSKAADAGNVRAMHNLAVMSAEGAGGKADYAKAANWFSKAADFGVRDSQFNLAILYARGLGIERNVAKSYTWFAIAAGQGDADAAKKRDEVGALLDAETLASAKAAADAFRATAPIAAANEVAPPPGGWDSAASMRDAPADRKPAAGKGMVM